MPSESPDIRRLQDAVLAILRATTPEALPDDIIIRVYTRSGFPLLTTGIPKAACLTRNPPPAERFIPNQLQEAVLEALEGKALRTDALANKVGSRSSLFQNPGGLEELKAHGLVAHHKRLGFYRPDAPPDELQGD